MLGNTFQ